MEELVSSEKVIASNEFAVGSVPTVFYIPDYITAAEEDQLLNNIYQAPISKWKSLKNRRLQNWGGVVHEKGLLAQDLPPWLKLVTNRIYEESSLFPSAINHVLINEYLPDQGIMPHQDGPAYVPVVAILSLGSPVVMDFVPHPSFRGTATEISGNNNEDIISKPENIEMSSGEYLSEYRPFSVALMPRSLLIFKDKAYSDFLHGIKDCEFQRYDEAVNVTTSLKSELQLAHMISGLKIDEEAGDDNVIHRTGTRVSLTCRVVTKVHKHLIKL
ncbi:UNVERIFIED_CONTAM: Alpha-ketoglutarate-dependent dioxygenase alkB6 [Sesamum latifolium]|uniref:Alpha-ketoglutarate-dependent dioxygenase alkB6 n=1 Tax=Sesamum latifolium TaxID=2727402 RepID=A0AAW2Y4E1_9LAMI